MTGKAVKGKRGFQSIKPNTPKSNTQHHTNLYYEQMFETWEDTHFLKKCSICNKDKEYFEFGILRSTKDGLNPYCKECLSVKKKEFYRNQKQTKLQYAKHLTKHAS